jgi:hypothetical protein
MSFVHTGDLTDAVVKLHAVTSTALSRTGSEDTRLWVGRRVVNSTHARLALHDAANTILVTVPDLLRRVTGSAHDALGTMEHLCGIALSDRNLYVYDQHQCPWYFRAVFFLMNHLPWSRSYYVGSETIADAAVATLKGALGLTPKQEANPEVDALLKELMRYEVSGYGGFGLHDAANQRITLSTGPETPPIFIEITDVGFNITEETTEPGHETVTRSLSGGYRQKAGDTLTMLQGYRPHPL